jgi:hypothetical protein
MTQLTLCLAASPFFLRVEYVVADFDFFKIKIASNMAEHLIADDTLGRQLHEMPAFGSNGIQKNVALLVRDRLRLLLTSLILSL